MLKPTVSVIAQEPSKTVRLLQMVQSLRKFGYNVAILEPRFNPRFKPRILSATLRYLGIMLQVLFAKADIYYVFNNPDVGFPALFKRGKLIYDVRNPWGAEVYDLTGRKSVASLCEWIERVLTTRADVVVAANHKLAERAKTWGAKRVFVVPNYPMSTFKPTLTREEVRDRHGLRGKKIALFSGNFSEVECAFDLVKLFPKVIAKAKDGVLIMIGEGEQRPLIEKFVEANRLEQNIRLVKRIPRQEVPNWLAAADVIVVPRKLNIRSAPFYCPESIWKVTEALWLGKPIVAGAVGGFLDTKLPIKVTRLEKFHEAIVEIFAKPQKTKPLKEISWNYCEEQLKKVLENVA